MRDRTFGLICFIGGAVFSLLWLLLSNFKAVSNPSTFDVVGALGAVGSVFAAAFAVYIAQESWRREDSRVQDQILKRRTGIALTMREPLHELQTALDRESINYSVLIKAAQTMDLEIFCERMKLHLADISTPFSELQKKFSFDYVAYSDYLEPYELERLNNLKFYVIKRLNRIQLIFSFINTHSTVFPYPGFALEQIKKLEEDNCSAVADLKSLLADLSAVGSHK
ncbi:hypothetical protein [Advenella sp. FME57]|uniref:hypothetical protein n=1 Tax=Advenella sp. FME57 TaxID=2742604 RepID=UPI001866A452|nr:hypothetical protein [Advenella sp. FME57]